MTAAEKLDQAIALLNEVKAGLYPASAPQDPVKPWTPLGGVLPEQVGNQAPMPRCFDTHRVIWTAAERGDPTIEGGPPLFVDGISGWPGPDGKAFRMGNYQRKGTQAVFDVINWFDSQSPECRAWKLCEGVAPFLPRVAPAMYPLSK